MKRTVHFIEEFNDPTEYKAQVQLYALTHPTKPPIMVYMYESSGYYNCTSSFEEFIQRNFAGDEEIEMKVIPTETVDTEGGQEKFHKWLLKNFSK